MILQNRASLTLSLLAMVLLLVTMNPVWAQSCPIPSGCPNFKKMEGGFPDQSNITVQSDTSDQTLRDATKQALDKLNMLNAALGNNVTFSLGTSFFNTNKVVLNFDMTTPHGPCGAVISLACTLTARTPDTTTVVSARTIVYLGSIMAGTTSTKFFEPNAPGFSDAVQAAVLHELMHTIGGGDAEGPGTLMSPMSGQNDLYGEKDLTPCDIADLSAARTEFKTGGSVCNVMYRSSLH
jgi:hypothetical protein